jgi:hypothetical protein
MRELGRLLVARVAARVSRARRPTAAHPVAAPLEAVRG